MKSSNLFVRNLNFDLREDEFRNIIEGLGHDDSFVIFKVDKIKQLDAI